MALSVEMQFTSNRHVAMIQLEAQKTIGQVSRSEEVNERERNDANLQDGKAIAPINARDGRSAA